MRVNVLASHRFHLLDLARELSSLGYDVRFYSYVPSRRCEVFGLNSRQCVSLLWLVWPFFALAKVAPRKYQQTIVWYRNLLMDWYVSLSMRRCDVCIGIGTVYLRSFIKARAMGATTILEWGSKHILTQQEKFDTLLTYPRRVLLRELSQYEFCDYISIPASHVLDSFVSRGIPSEKLLVNPYGVDLTHFFPKNGDRRFDLIYVGGWRVEKGCDLLIKLCIRYGYSLLHVGALVNLEFPQLPNMHHHDPVDQNDLVDYYAQARVFVLPSRSEGLAMVQAQAIACGIPVVCSKDTGGRDLGALMGDGVVFEMDDYSVESLNKMVMSAQGCSLANIALKRISWASYGKRYSDNLNQKVCLRTTLAM